MRLSQFLFMQDASPFYRTLSILFYDRLAQGQLVSAHCVISFMCVVTKKGVLLDYPYNHHLADLLINMDPGVKES